VFRAGDPYLNSDVVFGVRASLVADYVAHRAGAGPNAADIQGSYHTLDFNFVLQREPEAAKNVRKAAADS
jgi:hydroxyquinol 1,2-dioxygenase